MNPALVRQNYYEVLERIHVAAGRSGRSSADVRLVAVTKTHPPELIRAVAEAGARWVGENYVEEAIAKMSALNDLALDWHMIGHVQSRKAEQAVTYFPCIQTVDSVKLANRLERFAFEQDRTSFILLECNISGEATKSGWPVWDESEWPAFAEKIRPLLDLPHLHVQGLMTIAPYADDPEQARPYFRRLRRLGDFLGHRLPQADWSVLSMGMSGDFEVAIEEGATWVRIGSSIFGPRH